MIEKLKQAVVNNRNGIATAGLILISAISIFGSGFVLGRCSGDAQEVRTTTTEKTEDRNKQKTESGAEDKEMSNISLLGDIKISMKSDQKIRKKKTVSTKAPDGTTTTTTEETSVDTADSSESDISLQMKTEILRLRREYDLLESENEKLRLSTKTEIRDPHDKWLVQVSAGTDLKLKPVMGASVSHRITRHFWGGASVTSRGEVMGSVGVSF